MRSGSVLDTLAEPAPGTDFPEKRSTVETGENVAFTRTLFLRPPFAIRKKLLHHLQQKPVKKLSLFCHAHYRKSNASGSGTYCMTDRRDLNLVVEILLIAIREGDLRNIREIGTY